MVFNFLFVVAFPGKSGARLSLRETRKVYGIYGKKAMVHWYSSIRPLALGETGAWL